VLCETFHFACVPENLLDEKRQKIGRAILVATLGGPTMFVRIGVMRALTGGAGQAEMLSRNSG
jgi:hypothetical protein